VWGLAGNAVAGRATASGKAMTDVSSRGVSDLAAPHFETIVGQLDEGIVVMRDDGHIKFANPAAMQILDLTPEKLTADFATRADWSCLLDADGVPVPDDPRQDSMGLCARTVFSKQAYEVDLPTGECRWLLVSCRLVNLDASDTADLLISFADVSAQHAAVEQLVHQANHDPLTGLPNRGYVLRRITEALAADAGPRLRAVLFIDLDDLKTTNDTLGHDAGDVLLGAAAMRLAQTVGAGDVVGRHGGDEFVALVFGDATHDELNDLVDRLRCALAEPVAIVDTTTPIRASVGLVEVDRGDPRTAHEILRDADRAMYAAKLAGRRDCRRVRS
jgi:diguanylate cyclase (GGDEF)-like protein